MSLDNTWDTLHTGEGYVQDQDNGIGIKLNMSLGQLSANNIFDTFFSEWFIECDMKCVTFPHCQTYLILDMTCGQSKPTYIRSTGIIMYQGRILNLKGRVQDFELHPLGNYPVL